MGTCEEMALGHCDLGQSEQQSWDVGGAGGTFLTQKTLPHPSPEAEGPRSGLVPGSRPPSVEDVLQDGGCGESRSLTQSESDPPVDVFLPGNGRAVGAGAAGLGGQWRCVLQP